MLDYPETTWTNKIFFFYTRKTTSSKNPQMVKSNLHSQPLPVLESRGKQIFESTSKATSSTDHSQSNFLSRSSPCMTVLESN